MRVVLLGGTELMTAAAALGFEVSEERPEVALIDLRDATSLRGAAALPAGLPRVIVADADQRALARALAIPDDRIAASCEPALLGPLVASAVPPARPRPTRMVLVSSARGGTGRTLLVTNLSRRLAAHRSTVVLDVTGTGAAGWWLGVTPRPWSDLEGLGPELTTEHLAVVAEEAGPDLRVIGGAPHAPSAAAALTTARAAMGMAELVLVDAPVLADERTRALLELADRILVLTYGDPASRGTLDLAVLPAGTWQIASQRAGRQHQSEPEVFFSLPRDESSLVSAIASRGVARGQLGRAYDVLADLIAEDMAAR